MINQVAIIITIAAIMISLFGVIFQAQEVSAEKCINPTTRLPCGHPHPSPLPTTSPAGANTTTGANTTGNTTAGSHGSSIPTTNPAGVCLKCWWP